MRPESMTIISAPYSKTIMLRPISPNPPKGINRRPSRGIGMSPGRSGEVGPDPPLCLSHQSPPILHGAILRLDGLADDDPYISLFDPFGSPRHDLPGPMDGDGHNRDPRPDGQVKAPIHKGLHGPIKGAGTLRKDDYRGFLPDLLGGDLHALIGTSAFW